jgi:23S rRNA (guanosine2251-2'-O)-methyltransferase
MVLVRNLGDSLQTLTDRGFTCIGFDSEGSQSFADLRVPEPRALVFGAEGKGLRQRTRQLCAHTVRLDLPGKIPSLNVSNATALALGAIHYGWR